MVKKFVVVVHNHKWGDHYKEFDKKKEALAYMESCDVDINTYSWLYKLVNTWDEKEGQQKKKEKVQVPEPDPLEVLGKELNAAHEEYLKYGVGYKPKSKVAGYKEARDKYLQLAEEYRVAVSKDIKGKK